MKYSFPDNYSILTIATNNPSYLEFALNFAKSILLFNDIKIYIVTNINCEIPKDLKRNVSLVAVRSEHERIGIAIKLHLDKYAQTEHTLFIDSDCLCFDKLDKIFEGCVGQSVTCVGRTVPTADWCGKVLGATIKENWGLSELLRFNGGLYYIRQSDIATEIFDKAREIAKDYDDYGFSRIKNLWINEEVPLSIAMTLNKQTPLPDVGDFMTDLYTDYRPQLNVLKGTILLKNPPTGKPQHRKWYKQGSYSPIILHFGANNLKSYPYNIQMILLRLDSVHVNKTLSGIIVSPVHLLYRSYYFLKNLLR